MCGGKWRETRVGVYAATYLVPWGSLFILIVVVCGSMLVSRMQGDPAGSHARERENVFGGLRNIPGRANRSMRWKIDFQDVPQPSSLALSIFLSRPSLVSYYILYIPYSLSFSIFFFRSFFFPFFRIFPLFSLVLPLFSFDFPLLLPCHFVLFFVLSVILFLLPPQPRPVASPFLFFRFSFPVIIPFIFRSSLPIPLRSFPLVPFAFFIVMAHGSLLLLLDPPRVCGDEHNGINGACHLYFVKS